MAGLATGIGLGVGLVKDLVPIFKTGDRKKLASSLTRAAETELRAVAQEKEGYQSKVTAVRIRIAELAADAGDDGVITMREIAFFDLALDMAVMADQERFNGWRNRELDIARTLDLAMDHLDKKDDDGQSG